MPGPSRFSARTAARKIWSRGRRTANGIAAAAYARSGYALREPGPTGEPRHDQADRARNHETGHRQAKVTAEYLAGLDVAAVVASPLDRAQQTATPIAAAHNLPVGVDPRLASLRGDARYAALIARLRPEDLGYQAPRE